MTPPHDDSAETESDCFVALAETFAQAISRAEAMANDARAQIAALPDDAGPVSDRLHELLDAALAERDRMNRVRESYAGPLRLIAARAERTLGALYGQRGH